MRALPIRRANVRDRTGAGTPAAGRPAPPVPVSRERFKPAVSPRPPARGRDADARNAREHTLDYSVSGTGSSATARAGPPPTRITTAASTASAAASSANTLRIELAPSSPHTTGLTAMPTSDAVVSRPNPAPRDAAGNPPPAPPEG